MMLLLKDAFDKSFQRLAVLVTEMCTSRRGCYICYICFFYYVTYEEG